MQNVTISSILQINFPGGYFDSQGRPCYRHTDWQGNVTMVTDHTGQLTQHTGYYPYGEPWREPSGQPYLFGAKERLRDNGLNEYDFSARRYYSALGIWSTPDPLSADFAAISPYSYCAGNPVAFIDPSGCVLQFTNASQEDLERIKNIFARAVGDLAKVGYMDDGTITVTKNQDVISKSTNESEKHATSMLNMIVKDKSTTSIELSNSSEILIGNADKHQIDLDDIQNLGEEGPVNDVNALYHECIEQYYIQVKPNGKDNDEIKLNAHKKATATERIIWGASIDFIRPTESFAQGRFSLMHVNYNIDGPLHSDNYSRALIISFNHQGNRPTVIQNTYLKKH